MKEYAVYKGEELIVIGSVKECAEFMGVKPDYIYWMTTPTAKRRHAARANTDRCTTAIKLQEDEDDE